MHHHTHGRLLPVPHHHVRLGIQLLCSEALLQQVHHLSLQTAPDWTRPSTETWCCVGLSEVPLIREKCSDLVI